MTFYRSQRFLPIDATAPAKVQAWKKEHLAKGKAPIRQGEEVRWSPVGPAPKIMSDDEEDMQLLAGDLPNDLD